MRSKHEPDDLRDQRQRPDRGELEQSAPPEPGRDDALRLLRAFHRDVDAAAAVLEARHAGRLHCGRGCSACCVDDLGVLPVEAERIRRAHPGLLAAGRPHAGGACAFLDGPGACRIYADRPYVCRTQGLPLRWFDQGPDGEVREQRDICPENLEGPSLVTLPDASLWLLGPSEERLGEIQDRFGGDDARVPLRGLFERARAPGQG